MKNINLNTGGAMGAMLGMAAVATLVVSSGGEMGARIGAYGAIAVLVGDLGGHALWRLAFSSGRHR